MSVKAIIGVVLVAAAAAALLVASVRIVRPFQKGVVERLGKYKRTADPGFHMIIPGIDRMTRVDMRENVVEVPPQEVITKDNVEVTVDAVIYYMPVDAVKLIYNVTNFYLAATKLAQTSLRNVVGEMQLDETLTSREVINGKLRETLYAATEDWGVHVVRVELQRIDPPADVTQAMHRQMKAERERRAVVLEAEGERTAQVTRSEGVKQSAILEAEGRAAAIREVAAAERDQSVMRSEGEAAAIANVFQAIHEGDPSPDLLTLRYIDALKGVADGNATKIFMPLELEGLATAAGSVAEMLQSSRIAPAVKPAGEDVPPLPEVIE